jgi:hypothetical protein
LRLSEFSEPREWDDLSSRSVMKESSGSLRSVLVDHRPCNGDDPTEENNEMMGGWTHERNIAEILSLSQNTRGGSVAELTTGKFTEG